MLIVAIYKYILILIYSGVDLGFDIFRTTIFHTIYYESVQFIRWCAGSAPLKSAPNIIFIVVINILTFSNWIFVVWTCAIKHENYQYIPWQEKISEDLLQETHGWVWRSHTLYLEEEWSGYIHILNLFCCTSL